MKTFMAVRVKSKSPATNGRPRTAVNGKKMMLHGGEKQEENMVN